MKLPYFKLMEAFGEVKDSFTTGDGTEKATSVAKLLGKTAANVGMLAVDAGAFAIKNLPEIASGMAQSHLDKHSDSMTDEQRERAHRVIERANVAKERRMEREEQERRQKKEEQERKAADKRAQELLKHSDSMSAEEIKCHEEKERDSEEAYHRGLAKLRERREMKEMDNEEKEREEEERESDREYEEWVSRMNQSDL